MKCIHINTQGEQCNAYAMTDSSFCFTHNPDTKEAKIIAVKKGGLAAKNTRPAKPLKPLHMKKASDAVKLLEDTINRVRTDPMTPQQANCIGELVKLSFKAIELKEMEF